MFSNNNFQTQELTQKKKNPIIRLIKLIIWIGVIYGIIFYINYSKFIENIVVEQDATIIIEKGETFLDLSRKFDLNETYLKIYLRNNPPNYTLKNGTYKVEKGSNIHELLESLDQPIFKQATVVILEGWNIYDIDEYLTKQGFTEKGEYINYVTNPEKIKALNEFFPFLKGLETLEGFLYPDTYKVFSENFKVNNFVISQLEAFEEKVYNTILKKAGISNKEIQDLINLASIVEKEERNPKEKATVAGILKKRLNQGWMIGADITVCYPYKLTSEQCKLVVTKYINEVNQYNTRTMRGLPKTPIGNPNYQTINATLNHKDTPYYFYLHNVRTGKIYYAETNAGHEANKKYMR